MKILSITAQKPGSTGSGVFLTELVRVFSRQGHSQRVIAGVYRDDAVSLPEGVGFDPVYFDTDALPFPIAGMSDEMPYPSTRYCDMTPEMVRQFETTFGERLRRTMEEFRPDLILCHHLYLLTSLVREQVRDIPVYGFCHNTDLRQMKKHGLERTRIAAAIRSLDRIFVLRSDQMAEVAEIYSADPARMTAVGMGYNRDVFHPLENKDAEGVFPGNAPALDSVGSGATASDKTGGTAAADGAGGSTATADGASGSATASDKTGGSAAAPECICEDQSGAAPSVTRLVFAGKITQKKGVMSLIRSLQGLDFPRDSLTLVCAGGAGNEAEYRQIRELAETSRYPVSFPGRLEQTKLADIYRASDIFVLPSFYEGIPLTVIEALACGCRVVVSDLPGVKDWLDEFVSGADIRYVTLPRLQNADEPLPEDFPAFEERLTQVIGDSIRSGISPRADVSRISWERIAQMAAEI